jgi:hypothetical protein
MDLTSTVRSDTLPAVGSFLVPGAVASSPYVALLWGPPHDLRTFVDANAGASTVAAAMLTVAAGLLIDSIGSYVEYYGVDRLHKNRAEMLSRWKEYLRIAWKTEPIGQHYLRRILTIFKFELNLLVASILTIPGTVALWWFSVLSPHGARWILAITGVLVLYLCRACYDTSVLLDELRTELVAQANESKRVEGTGGQPQTNS